MALTDVVDPWDATALGDQQLARFFEGAAMNVLKQHAVIVMRDAFSEGQGRH